VDHLRLLETSRQAGHNGHDNEILSIIENLCEASQIKLTSFYTRRSVAMPNNKFGLSLGRGSELRYHWHRLLRSYVHDNALSKVATDFDAKIRRFTLPVNDVDTVNKRYVQQSIQDLKNHLKEIKRKLQLYKIMCRLY